MKREGGNINIETQMTLPSYEEHFSDFWVKLHCQRITPNFITIIMTQEQYKLFKVEFALGKIVK